MTPNYAVSATTKHFLIDVISGSSVKFYINGVLVGELTTNIPSQALSMSAFIDTQTPANKGMWVKYFHCVADRYYD